MQGGSPGFHQSRTTVARATFSGMAHVLTPTLSMGYLAALLQAAEVSPDDTALLQQRSEEHTSELQSQ